jgi:hypothetical protein
MDLIVSRWRTLLMFAVLGSALAFAWRGDWAWVIGAAVLASLRVAGWVGGELVTTREVLRGQPQPATGRHAKRTAGLEQPYTCSRCGEPGVTTWDSEQAKAEGQGLDLVCDRCFTGKLRLAAVLGVRAR